MQSTKVARTLAARPAGHNYIEELKTRFGAQPLMLRMCDSMGSGEPRRPYQLAEGIAIIDISGVLVSEAWYWDETQYSDIRDEVTQALGDSQVKGILLRVSSPGGETDGAFETAAFLADAGKKKPMWSAMDPYGYSAGYLLPSQTAKIYLPPTTGGVGSVGVYSMHADYSGMLKKNGIDVTFMSAGKGKTDGNPYEPLSPEAKVAIQAEVDRLYGEFVGAVSRGRKMSEQAVRDLGAYCYDGAKAALGAGLADAAGSLDQAWFDMAAFVAAPTNSPAPSGQTGSAKAEKLTAPAAEHLKEVPMSTTSAAAGDQTADLKFTQADVERLVAEGLARAKGEGREEATAEALEIEALCRIAGRSSMAGAFITGKKTVADVRKELNALAVAAEKEEINSRLQPPPAEAAKKSSIVTACEKLASTMFPKKEGK